MGIIGKVLQAFRTTRNVAKIPRARVQSATTGVTEQDQYAPAGLDSAPLKNDYSFSVPTERTGGMAVLGYIDPANEGKSAPGETRTYARNPAGALVSEVWQKNSGEVLISNALGYIKLGADGVVDINGLIIGLDGNATTASGTSLDDHTHDFEYTDTGNPAPNPQTGTTQGPN